MTICKNTVPSVTPISLLSTISSPAEYYIPNTSLSKKCPSKVAVKRASADATMVSPHTWNRIDLALRASTSASTSPASSFSDEGIQSTGSRRRYMRRGSRAPSMFVVCLNDLERSLENEANHLGDPFSPENTENDDMQLCNRSVTLPRPPRRISMTTSLYQKLGELSLTSDHRPSVQLDHNSYMKMQRRFSYDQAMIPVSDSTP